MDFNLAESIKTEFLYSELDSGRLRSKSSSMT